MSSVILVEVIDILKKLIVDAQMEHMMILLMITVKVLSIIKFIIIMQFYKFHRNHNIRVRSVTNLSII